MGSRIGNHRFPNLSNTNSQKCENSFSHSCKLVLLGRRIVAHATCFIHSKKVKITIGTFIGLAYVLMYFCPKIRKRFFLPLVVRMTKPPAWLLLNLMYLCTYVYKKPDSIKFAKRYPQKNPNRKIH